MSCPERCTSAGDAEAGSALIIVLIGMMLLSAIGLATLMLATADTLAAANQRDARAALFAAEAGIEMAAAELADAPDWDAVFSGAAVSAFADGAPSGARVLPDGSPVQLQEVANQATCGNASNCTVSAREEVTEDRPWGPNNPDWRLYRYGRIDAGGSAAGVYVIVLVADDPAESDGNPSRDGVAPENPGAGVLALRAEAFGPGASRRSVEAVVSRAPVPSASAVPRFLSWREVR
jgi:hypothetical protein